MCQLFSMLVIVHLHESKKALPRVDIWHAYVLQAVQLNDLSLQVGFYSSLVACHEKNNVSHTHTANGRAEYTEEVCCILVPFTVRQIRYVH